MEKLKREECFKTCRNWGWNIPNLGIFLTLNYIKLVVNGVEKRGKCGCMIRYLAGWTLYGLKWMVRDARMPVAFRCPEWYSMIEVFVWKHDLLGIPMAGYKEQKGCKEEVAEE